MQAKVEIRFDNSDHRLLQDAIEVRIGRQIGQKKDQYFIGDRVVTRTDVSVSFGFFITAVASTAGVFR